MASIGHVAVGMATARARSRKSASVRELVTSTLGWSALSMLPDLDVIGRAFGVRYGAAWGHRGATHSIFFCLCVALFMGCVAPRLGLPRVRTAFVAALVLVSHPLLDTLTDGGRGCALLWPFDARRFFAPWRPIPVAPIGLRFLSLRGLRVALAELVIFAPLFLYALWPRRKSARKRS